MTKPLQSIVNGLSFSSPLANSTDPQLAAGDELSFSYGAHEDAMLLTEYGFTLGPTNEYNNVDIGLHVAALFEEQAEEGRIKRGVLEDSEYWG
jgi:hypothetical protein